MENEKTAAEILNLTEERFTVLNDKAEEIAEKHENDESSIQEIIIDVIEEGENLNEVAVLMSSSIVIHHLKLADKALRDRFAEDLANSMSITNNLKGTDDGVKN